MKIGVFDSGIGGLTVVKELILRLPHVSFCYYADTAYCPYGDRTKEELWQRTNFILNVLENQHVDAVIIACNTISSLFFHKIKSMKSYPIYSIIEPAVKAAVLHSRNKQIGVIGTTRTIESNAYVNFIRAIDTSYTVLGFATPTLVPMIESGIVKQHMLMNALSPLSGLSIDTCILGCTHYPIIECNIASILGERVKLINPAVYLIDELIGWGWSEKNGMKLGNRLFLTSGDEETFLRQTNIILE
jgi:glutamate racemase